MLSKKDRSSYDKMADLFAESNNRQILRDYMGSIKLPCLPYLGNNIWGMILKDVMIRKQNWCLKCITKFTALSIGLCVLNGSQTSNLIRLPWIHSIGNHPLQSQGLGVKLVS